MSDAAAAYAAFRERQRYSELQEFSAALDFSLDDFQIAACRAISDEHNVVVSAPTGAGKTIIAVFALSHALKEGKRAFYTTPIKALSNQKYRELSERFGREQVGLLTGDTTINSSAPILVMTTEVVRNMIYRGSDLDDVDVIVLDEVHYLADRLRGPVWEEVIIHAPAQAKIVALSATIRNTRQFADWIDSLRGPTEIATTDVRPVPLEQHVALADRIYPLFVRSDAKKRPGKRKKAQLNGELVRAFQTLHGQPRRPERLPLLDAMMRDEMTPAIEFIFSRAGCEEAARAAVAGGFRLRRDREEQLHVEQLIEAALIQLDSTDWAVLGIDAWKDLLLAGVGVHHAGLLPIQKEITEVLFSEGLLAVVYATETLALGINMPARSVVIESLTKFDGVERVRLSASDFMQLGGRAGRRGIDTVGHVIVPAVRGVHPQVVADLASSPPEPLRSAFQPTYNMVVNLLSRTDLPHARGVMDRSFAQFCISNDLRNTATKLRVLEDEFADLEERLSCSYGSVPDYLHLAASISGTQSEESSGLAREVLSQLQPGAVIEAPVGRRNRLGIVLKVQHDPFQLEVLAEDASLRIFTGGIIALHGDFPIPAGFRARQPRERAKLASELRQAKRAGKFVVTPVVDSGIERRQQLQHHPVRNCPDFKKHMRLGRRYLRLEKRLQLLRDQRREREQSLATQFDRIVAVLQELGYLTEAGQPTAAGKVLAAIYAERDLLIAQAGAAGIFNEMSAPVTAGALAAILYRADTSFQQPSSRQLRQAISRIEELAKQLAKVELRAGIEPDEPPNAGLAQATFMWCAGRSLSTCLAACDLAPGDFVRWMRSIIDACTHLRPLLGDARVDAVIKGLRRGVVAA